MHPGNTCSYSGGDLFWKGLSEGVGADGGWGRIFSMKNFMSLLTARVLGRRVTSATINGTFEEIPLVLFSVTL